MAVVKNYVGLKKVYKRKKEKTWNQRLSKAQRQAWWYSLTDEQRMAYLEKKQAERSERNKGVSNCPKFGRIDSSNREEWQSLILRKNPWLDEEVFEAA